MDKVTDFPDRRQIEQEASEWLIRLDSENRMQPEEIQALREWMHRSPVHRDELISFGEFWSNQSLVALPISLQELYYRPEPVTGRTWGGLWPVASLATGLLVLVSLLGLWLFTDSYKEQNELYATAVGQQREISLPDGSKMFLNTNSQVKVVYAIEHRDIFLLQGEAHFDVAKQKDRPFRVYAGNSRVQAVGTAFTVYYRHNNDVDVTVSEGKVALGVFDKVIKKPNVARPNAGPKAGKKGTSKRSPDGYLAVPVDELGVLKAGQTTTILVAQEPGEPENSRLGDIKNIAPGEIKRREAWRSGVLDFAGTSLEEVVDEMSRYTTISIDIKDPELKKIRIGGRFDVGSTDALFDALEANFGLQITRFSYNHVQISSAIDEKK
ncbi:FecR family protein [Porticoccus sp. GXU_MW_L64]